MPLSSPSHRIDPKPAHKGPRAELAVELALSPVSAMVLGRAMVPGGGWRPIGRDVHVNARHKELVGVFAHPEPPQRSGPMRCVRGQGHVLWEVLAGLPMVICVGGIPVFMNIDPLGETVLPKAVFGFGVGVGAEAPLRVAVVVRVQRNVCFEGEARNICPIAGPCSIPILAKPLGVGTLISSCGTHAGR